MSLETEVNVVLVHEAAITPQRQTDGAAGYDLYSIEELQVEPGSRKMIRTGVQIEIPPGTYGRIAPRSSLALNHGIDVGAGVIDSDYRGEICVILFNHSTESFSIKVGDRIAQLIFVRIETPAIRVSSGLSVTKRGASGFGSTGS